MAISRGSIARSLSPDGVVQGLILQVLNIKGMNGNERYKMTLTDGETTIFATTATQLSSMVAGGEIRIFSVIRLVEHVLNVLGGTPILILLNLDVLEHLNGPIPGAPIVTASGGEGGENSNAQQKQQQIQNQHHQPPAYGSGRDSNSNGQQQQSVYGAPSNPPPNNNQNQQQNQSSYQNNNQYNSPSPAHVQGQSNVPAYGQQQNNYGNQAQNTSYQGQGQGQSVYGSSNNNNNGDRSSNQSSGAYGQQGGAYGGQANSRPVVRDDGAAGNIVPISAINPYSSKWTIKARVTSKSDIRRWSNAKGEGHLFSMDLMDSAGTEIRGTFFKEACDKFYPIVQEGKVFTFSQGRLKVVVNKQFTTIKNNYELTFDQNSDIKPCQDTDDIKAYAFNFQSIAQLANVETNHMVDLLAIVRGATDCVELISQKLGGKVLYKRDLTVFDASNTEVRLTLWGDRAQESPPGTGSVIVVKNCKVGEYLGGKSLGTSLGSSMMINPEIDEARTLYEWSLQNAGNLPPPANLSASADNRAAEPLEKRKAISAIREESMGLGEKPDNLTIKATINYIKHDSDPWYTSCSNPSGCLKKVTEQMGAWRCEKCNQEFATTIRRYVLSLTATDQSGQVWLSLFNETAIKLLGGYSADQLYEMKVAGDEQQYEQIMSDALFKTYLLRVRVKQEMVNEEPRVKSTVIALEDLDYVSECQQMIDAINKYM